LKDVPHDFFSLSLSDWFLWTKIGTWMKSDAYQTGRQDYRNVVQYTAVRWITFCTCKWSSDHSLYLKWIV